MTDSKIIWLRLIGRYIVAILLVVAIVGLAGFIVLKLPPEPNDALIAILGAVFAALAGVLYPIGKAISSNMESKNGNGEE